MEPCRHSWACTKLLKLHGDRSESGSRQHGDHEASLILSFEHVHYSEVLPQNHPEMNVDTVHSDLISLLWAPVKVNSIGLKMTPHCQVLSEPLLSHVHTRGHDCHGSTPQCSRSSDRTRPTPRRFRSVKRLRNEDLPTFAAPTT